MKVSVIVKGIINYIFAIIFAMVFGLFLDANVGWFILLTLILAPLMSVFLAWIASHLLSVTCHMEDALLSKGDTCNMAVSVRNKSIFPTPPVSVLLTNEAGVKSNDGELIVSAMSRTAKDFEVSFTAKICGMSTVGVETVRVTDYLGLFSFKAKHIDYDLLKSNVAVIPDIAQIGARDDAIVKVMQTSHHMDDSDDTVESQGFQFGGFPGYDNREYVPGDPIKRINWKQSAKREKLLVRLDDEMASQSINVVLDSVLSKNSVNLYEVAPLVQYRDLEIDEIIPTIAQEAIENALGITRVLIRHNYTVNFYAYMKGNFVRYEIADEMDLENLRLELAGYVYSTSDDICRLPVDDAEFREKVGIFSTPSMYGDAQAVLDSEAGALYTTVFSAVEEARKQGTEGGIELKKEPVKKEVEKNLKQRIVLKLSSLMLPFFLSLLLSTVVFSAYDVDMLSGWTLIQAMVCAEIMALCEYVKKHKVVGGLILVVLIVVLLNISTTLMFAGGYQSYMRWFVSAGDYVETTSTYLITLVMIFTVFFALVVYYFTKIQYRTSFLLLVSMIPLILYVKVMKPIDMTQVVFITVLNVAAFLINIRTIKDKGKRIIGYVSGIVSVGFYAILFIMVGLSVRDADTPYYYMFEDAFLGGNATEPISEGYSALSEYSGNADNYQQSDNRKLYVVTGYESMGPLYLKKQVFDYYDFDNDRWYADDDYSWPMYVKEAWQKASDSKQLDYLMEALYKAEEYEPGLLAKYGIKQLPYDIDTYKKSVLVQATNFANGAYITPPNTASVTVKPIESGQGIYVTRQDVFRPDKGLVDANIMYQVEYYDNEALRQAWIDCGGANMDTDTSLVMLQDVKNVLSAKGETELEDVLDQYITEAQRAGYYADIYEENNRLIPARVSELAKEITKDCTYDWEKAAALQAYFENNDFVYDLSYDVPDDSVEYFLFEGKTGTCSDYASAYVLMARSVGLVVRYAEGYVPDMELSGELVVRTNSGHAYPEVYIQNVGYVIYEATKPAVYNETEGRTNGFAGYFVYAGFRAMVIFGIASLAIIVVLFIYKVVAPYVSELHFKSRLRKVTPGEAVVMLYKRLQHKSSRYIVNRPECYTPYEYATEYERLTGYDISELTLMVENVAYGRYVATAYDIANARKIYGGVAAVIKQFRSANRQQKESYN